MTTTTVIQDIIVDPEYSDVAPKMSDAEFESLKESIAEYGQQVSITTNAEGVLLDGHNRYRANNELGIMPNVEIKTFQDRAHEKLFVIICAQNRRNLNEAQKAILALEKHIIKLPFQRRDKKDSSQCLGDTLEIVPRLRLKMQV
jgi:hypothetical protein